jgi:hypothetical protein
MNDLNTASQLLPKELSGKPAVTMMRGSFAAKKTNAIQEMTNIQME